MSFKVPRGLPPSKAPLVENSPPDDCPEPQEEKTRPQETSHDPSEPPYNEPTWSGPPSSPSYALSVIKNGVQIDTIKLANPYYTIGRLLSCNIHLEHPSISRYHAVIQHRPISGTDTPESTLFSTNPSDAGFYVYDLGSTHGTYLNKNRLQPRCYYRIRVGQMVKFGGSSRIFVLDVQSTESLQEVVEEEAKAEIQLIKEKEEEYRNLIARSEAEKIKREEYKESLGATWGLLTDDEMVPNDERGTEKMELDPIKESYYIEDPKKALKKFFDREGLELEYETEESGTGRTKTYTVSVRLPIETLDGESIYAKASQTGNKKEAVVLCALEACRLLDAEGVLRESMTRYKRKTRNWEENDYYDSDEDNFLDRTGDVDKKRKSRMRRVGKIGDSLETYESLKSKLAELETELNKLQKILDDSKRDTDWSVAAGDSLDTYMKSIKGQVDKQKQSEIKLQINQLKKEEAKLKKLIKISEPYKLPGIESVDPLSDTVDTVAKEDIDNIQKEDTHNKKTPSVQKRVPQRDISPNPAISSPTLPSSETVLSLKTDSSSPALSSTDDFPLPKKKKLIGPSLPPQQETNSEKKVETWNEENEEDYASWLPPEDQTGDGKTKLNERYGY